jgi:FkbM family methyltransferase
MNIKRLETRHGPMFAFGGDRFITRCLEVYQEYSPKELDLLSQIAKPGMDIVEAGANIGVHAIPLARRCHPGRLFAFEPQQRVFQVLCANLVLNDIENVIARPDACGERPGQAAVPDMNYGGDGNFGGVSLREAEAGGMLVPVVTIDSLNLPSCGLIKVDVEGFEAQVIRGAAETIARCRPRIYVENDRREKQQELIQLLDGMGYRLYWHLPPLAHDGGVSAFGQVLVSVNMLALPKESATKVEGMEEINPHDWSHPLDRAGR